MKKLHYRHLWLLMILFVFSQKSISQNFIDLPSGVSYTILQHSITGEKLAYDKFINFHIEVKTDLGKVLESSFKLKKPKKFVPIKPKQFDGDPSEILPFLANGDSAVCKVPVELLAQRVGGSLEQIVGNANFILYTFKILDVLDAEEMALAKKEEEAKKREQFETQKRIDDEKIQIYLKQNNLTTQKTASGLHYMVKKQGTGVPIQLGTDVKVHYIGKLLNGKMFDTSREEVAKANNLHNPNRNYGVALMSQGAHYLFIIPSHLGYGRRGAGANIPPNSVLIFDVEVL